MTASPQLRICRLALGLLASLAMSAPVSAGPATMAAVDARPAFGAVQLVAMGDLPTVPQRQRRGGGRRAKAKDNKPYQPLSKDVQGESAEAHKEYLKRNGF